MPSTGPRAKNWCFTLNNYTPEDVDRLSTPIVSVSYLIYGKEVGASGTPHLQGTVCFKMRKRLNQVTNIIGQAHCTVTRNLNQSIVYCKKDGEYTEVGVQTVTKKQEDCIIEAFKQTVNEGVTDKVELREIRSEVCAKYPKFVSDFLGDKKPKHNVPVHPLREWQQELYGRLRLAPCSREIIFIIDSTGNQGKSWFARYYTDLHANAQIVVPCKKADMAYMVRDDAKVFFFDCPRSKQGDFIQYDFLEELKNGYIISPKYESTVKKLAIPHVVVLMNEYPDQTKLSEDRYSIKVLT